MKCIMKFAWLSKLASTLSNTKIPEWKQKEEESGYAEFHMFYTKGNN